jgi:hypothetical protein
MTEVKESSFKGFEFFTNPSRIVDYSENHGSFRKFSILVVLIGILLGFNFFHSNFMLPLLSIPPMLYFVISLLAVVIFSVFMVLYPFLIWLMVRVHLKISDKKRKNIDSVNSNVNLITKSNLIKRILVISYCFLIPLLLYELVSFSLTILLYVLKAIYLVVIIKDFGTIMIYVWIIPLTLYSIRDLDKSQKYKMEAFILIALFIAHMAQYFTVSALSQIIAKILPGIV